MRIEIEGFWHSIRPTPECEHIFTDTLSGSTTERPSLTQAIDYVHDGDTLIFWRLDRLGRSLQHLIETVNAMEQCGIGFMSLTESIDTTTPGARLIFQIFGSLAELERSLICERTVANLAAARARKVGRPKSLTKRQVALAKHLHADKETDITTIC